MQKRKALQKMKVMQKSSNFFSFLVVYKSKKQLIHICTFADAETTAKRLKTIYKGKQIVLL